MTLAAIVDYGLCNIDSVKRAIEECGASAFITDDPNSLRDVSHIVLPGVGAFGDAMANLRANHLDEALHTQVIEKQTPFLGICLGMQLMAASSTEHGDHRGLGWIDAQVQKITPYGSDQRVPHIGWNQLCIEHPSPLFEGIESGRDVYFVHSYVMTGAPSENVVGTTPYAGSFISAVQREWIFGTQFHPEKSQKVGFQMLRNFLAY
jgi:imidazole glycerol-phosphate synthase subunit HisH